MPFFSLVAIIFIPLYIFFESKFHDFLNCGTCFCRFIQNHFIKPYGGFIFNIKILSDFKPALKLCCIDVLALDRDMFYKLSCNNVVILGKGEIFLFNPFQHFVQLIRIEPRRRMFCLFGFYELSERFHLIAVFCDIGHSTLHRFGYGRQLY